MERGSRGIAHTSRDRTSGLSWKRREKESDRWSFAFQGSEEEDQETTKEGQKNFGTVDLVDNLEAGIPEDGIGKEEQS